MENFSADFDKDPFFVSAPFSFLSSHCEWTGRGRNGENIRTENLEDCEKLNLIICEI